jgi:diguanylate cyclase (GGDEF)-like protein
MCLADVVLKGDVTDEELTSLYDSHISQPVIDRTGESLHALNWCVVPNIPGEKYLSFDAGPIYNECGEIVAVVETISDLTELKNTQIKLEKLATVDALTGVANRRHFDEQLNSIWLNAQRYQQPLSLLMIDVDYFKLYNDIYGHQAGDSCLIKVANCIDSALKRSLDNVFRYGGEEFVVLLPDTNQTGAYYMAERIREAVIGMALAHEKSRVSEFVTVSIGIATLRPTPQLKSEKLVSVADKALYTAKAEGRNRGSLAV